MNCIHITENMEEYIMGELDAVSAEAVKQHLGQCPHCLLQYEETRDIIQRLRNFKYDMNVKKGLFDMRKRKVKTHAPGKSIFRFLPTAAACVFFGISLITTSVLAFPSFAQKYTPELPLIRQLTEAKEQNRETSRQLDSVKLENEQMKIQLKNISGEQVKEVTTSTGVDEQVNSTIQSLVVEFIKAQYTGDMDKILSVSTPEFKEFVQKNKEYILFDDTAGVVFTQITNVAKEGDKYLVFVRLNDGKTKGDADFQQNFEVVQDGAAFLIASVGLDA